MPMPAADSPLTRSLYRSLLREVRRVRAAPLQRKLGYNIRQLFDFYSGSPPASPELLAALHDEARAALRVLRWLRGLPEVRGGGRR